MNRAKKAAITNVIAALFCRARPARLELTTSGSGGQRSIQLSYGRVCIEYYTAGTAKKQTGADSMVH